MQAISRTEFLELLGLTSGAFDQLQHAGHVALAFGTPLPATPGRYLDLDLVAMAINLGLTPSLGREVSTVIVSGFTVNVSEIIRRLRARAQTAGIDLSRPFFFLPDDPRFAQILTQVKRERNARIARFRRDKKKFAAAKARRRRQQISELPRVRNVDHQFAI